jgi:hypothetical protein
VWVQECCGFSGTSSSLSTIRPSSGSERAFIFRIARLRWTAEPLRHRQTKEAETDMPSLTPPRHTPTLRIPAGWNRREADTPRSQRCALKLGGKLPFAMDSFARFARSSYLRAMRRSCTTAVSRRLERTQPTRHRAAVSVAAGTAAFSRFVVGAAGAGPRSPRRTPATDHRTTCLARSSSQIFRCWSFGKSASFSPETHIGAPAFCREATSWSASCWRE